MRHKLPLIAVLLCVLLASGSAILYWGSRASAEDPAGILSSPLAAPYACLSSQEEYDSCVAVGRVPVDDAACPSFSKFVNKLCIAYGAYTCTWMDCTEWSGGGECVELVKRANTADTFCWSTPDMKTIATSKCESGWACPQEQTPFVDDQTCIASFGVPEDDPLCLTGRTCLFYSNASVACRDLEFGECVVNNAQVASCAAIGGTRVEDTACPWRPVGDLQPGNFLGCMCPLPFVWGGACVYGDVGDCSWGYGVVKVDEEHCGSVGGMGCYEGEGHYDASVQEKCISAAPVGGEAEYPQVQPAAASTGGGSPARDAFALALWAAGSALLLTAVGWYARRRWLS